MSYASRVAALGATAYYRLGEASGTTITDAIGSANGTYVNTPDLAQTGAIRDGDTAVNFKSASSERGTLTTLGSFGSNLGTCSVAFWLKTTTTTKSAALGFTNAGTATSFLVQVASSYNGTQTTNALRAFSRNEATNITQAHILSSALFDGNWHFVAIVSSATGWKFYVDGAAVTATTTQGDNSGTYANAGVAMDIGSQNANGTHQLFLNGALDEVAFFPSRLDPEDIRALWGDGAIRSNYGSTQTTGAYYTAVQALTPKLYWRLDEPDGTYYAKDISGNGNDGFYLGTDVAFAVDGRVDSANDSFRMTSHDGFGVVRANSYAPFVPGGKITVCGVSRTDSIVAARYQNLFSAETQPGASGQSSPALEGLNAASGGGDTIRFYADVASDFPGFKSTDWDDADPPAAAWFHWAFTFDDSLTPGASAATLYINGVQKTPSIGGLTWANHFVNGTGRFQVGNRGDGIASGNQENFQGEHDEIAVWERVLSQSEIRGLVAAADIAFFDSRSVTVTLTPTGSGVYGYTPDSRTATAAVTPTRTESQTGTDARTITVPITLSASESWSHFPDIAFEDSGSVTVAVTPTRTEAHERLASGSGTAAVTPTGAESYGFVGTGTATVTLALTRSENFGYTGAQSVTVAITPTATEAASIADAGTVAVDLTPTGTHPGFSDSGFAFIEITAFGTPFEDSGTVTVEIAPTGSLPPVVIELTDLVGAASGHLERDESGHMEFATAGRTT